MVPVRHIHQNLRIHQQKYLILSWLKNGGCLTRQRWTRVFRPAQKLITDSYNIQVIAVFVKQHSFKPGKTILILPFVFSISDLNCRYQIVLSGMLSPIPHLHRLLRTLTFHSCDIPTDTFERCVPHICLRCHLGYSYTAVCYNN